MTKKEPTDKEIFDTDNYIAFSFQSYNTLLLPHKEAMMLFSIMAKIELLESSMYEVRSSKIKFHNEQNVQFDSATVTRKQYKEAKVKFLLGVTEEEPTE